MDPRTARTARALAAAVLDLAAERPIGTVTVAQVATRAGVTRATFYKHAADPAEILVRRLGGELARLQALFADRAAHAAGDLRQTFRDAVVSLLEHVAAHARVYERALQPSLDPRLRGLLTDYTAATLRRHLEAYPRIMPGHDALAADPAALALAADVHVAFAAHGTVGAIEVWLRHGGGDAPAGAEAIVGSSPTWWYTPVGGAGEPAPARAHIPRPAG